MTEWFDELDSQYARGTKEGTPSRRAVRPPHRSKDHDTDSVNQKHLNILMKNAADYEPLADIEQYKALLLKKTSELPQLVKVEVELGDPNFRVKLKKRKRPSRAASPRRVNQSLSAAASRLDCAGAIGLTATQPISYGTNSAVPLIQTVLTALFASAQKK